MAYLSASLLMEEAPRHGLKPRHGQELPSSLAGYGPALRRYFSRRANTADVDDLVQEVFVRLHGRSGDPIENIEHYLFKVAHHVLVSQQRSRALRSFASYDIYEDSLENADPISPERIAIGRDEYARIVQAIVNLPPRARQAFQLHRFDHLTYQEIAKRMGITKDSVKELMHRALLSLARQMEHDG